MVPILHQRTMDETMNWSEVKVMNICKMAAAIVNFPLVSLSKSPKFLNPSNSASTFVGSSPFLQSKTNSEFESYRVYRKRGGIVCGLPLLVDPWAPTIDSQSIATQLFAFSLFPYIGFLYFITKSKTAPNLTLFGFYFLLAFVGATSQFLSFYFAILLPHASSFLLKIINFD